MPSEREVSLFRDGRNQAIRIPREFELKGNKAMIHKEGNRLIIEPENNTSLLDVLSGMEPITDQFPDVDTDPGSLDDIEL
jgi:antitoxin VapB